jgi:hypothetical protein
MRTRILLAVLSLAVAAQLWVPASLILRSELTLATGTAYRFRTEPVDPYDAFRGRYVALGFADDEVACGDTGRVRPGRHAYALLTTDAGGFARVSALAAEKPRSGDCVRVMVRGESEGTVSFSFPFDRLFLEENLAPAAERLYRERNLAGAQDSYLVVRVRNGFSVIEDLFIAGLPVRESVRRHPAGQEVRAPGHPPQ